MRRFSRLVASTITLACTAALALLAEGISAHVVTIDHKKQCLTVDWHNDTEKPVCWTAKTKFTVLDTGKPAEAADVRKGSYLRMEGSEKEGTYIATEIAIWEAASNPEK